MFQTAPQRHPVNAYPPGSSLPAGPFFPLPTAQGAVGRGNKNPPVAVREAEGPPHRHRKPSNEKWIKH